MKGISQNKMVLDHLESGKGLTSMGAISLFKITRLSARIKDLRDQGHDIQSEMKSSSDSSFGKHAEYTLIK